MKRDKQKEEFSFVLVAVVLSGVFSPFSLFLFWKTKNRECFRYAAKTGGEDAERGKKRKTEKKKEQQQEERELCKRSHNSEGKVKANIIIDIIVAIQEE
jgi:hypothetical protein